MTRDSIIELQRLDCNCNECGYMVRNIARSNTVYAVDFDSQVDFFRSKKARRIRAAREKIRKDAERGAMALEQALAMNFNYFPQKVPVCYGHCDLFDKEVSFLPGTFQFETQPCFFHRKDNLK